jgi:hypothetical protein
MGILEIIAAMEIGRLILLGIFFIIALALLVGGIFLSTAVIADSDKPPPWVKTPATPRHAPRKRSLSFGIVLLALGVGILASAYGVSQPSAWGVAGTTILCGGIGLIISYFVESAIDRRHQAEKKEETD